MIRSYQWVFLTLLGAQTLTLDAKIKKHVVVYDTLLDLCQDAEKFAITKGLHNDTGPDISEYIKLDRSFFAVTKIYGHYAYFVFDNSDDIAEIIECISRDGGLKIEWYYTDGFI